jgi:Fe-S-cluster containining protein
MTLTEADERRLEAAGFSRFVRETEAGEPRLRNRDGRCVFLSEGDCRAYAARPEGCRLYPLVLDLDQDRVVLHDFCPHRDEFRFTAADERRLRRSVAADEAESERRWLRRAARTLGVALLLLAGGLAAADEVGRTSVSPPWEVWHDLALLAVIPAGDRVVMRSSFCEDGCAFDRHSSGDSRFLSFEEGEGVLFEGRGPGAVTRIWMTQGDDGVSRPLDPEIWIRIVVDGEVVVQLPLPEFFDGQAPPFAPPLVSHRLLASGGNVSYVPIPYRDSCVVSLLGAEHAKIWFQITAHELDGGETEPFTGGEDLRGWRELLATEPGGDPWRGGPFPTTSGSVELRRNARVVIAALAGADVVNGVLLRLPRRHWDDVELRLIVDGELRVAMPLSDFFGAGEDGADSVRSLLVGVTADEDLYAYFPMPYFEGVMVELARGRSRGRPKKMHVEYAVRRLGRHPDPDSGLFGAERHAVERTTPGSDHEVLSARGRGKWVGLVAWLGPVSGSSRDYLEGDERVVLDGAAAPQLHGTGVEDFFGGGFYFQVDHPGPLPFAHPLHGMADDRAEPDGTVTTQMYRLMLTDAPVWRQSVQVGLECGPTNQTPLRARTVAYYYSSPSPSAR